MSQTREKYTRVLPFVRVLDKSNKSVNKSDVLKKFPKFVTDDIIELLHNILIGKLHIQSSSSDNCRSCRSLVMEPVPPPLKHVPSLESRKLSHKTLYRTIQTE